MMGIGFGRSTWANLEKNCAEEGWNHRGRGRSWSVRRRAAASTCSFGNAADNSGNEQSAAGVISPLLGPVTPQTNAPVLNCNNVKDVLDVNLHDVQDNSKSIDNSRTVESSKSVSSSLGG